ncbi:MAG: hypothetical protein Q9206_000552 [Seirophora lacunosa]
MFAQDDLFPPPQETVSMAETIYSASTPAESVCDVKEEDEEKKPKKRKSWGQELPVPKTNLPPRKRAKTEDEKEQRRIERVLRNRQAAQSSRERKRQEVEKLEGEKSAIETQNDMLKERLMAVEHEKFKLEQQLSQLTAENAALRSGSSPPRASLTPPSDFAADLLDNQKAIKQEIEDSLFALRTPISLPSDSFSPSPSASTDSRSPDVVRPAVSIQGGSFSSHDSTYDPRQSSVSSVPITNTKPQYPGQPVILSDSYYSGLFAAPPSPPSHLSFFEEGLASTGQPDDPSNVFTFDSMVDLDACGSNGILDGDNNDCTFGGDHDFFQNNDSLPADISHQTPPASPALQPCLGAPSSGRDGSGNAS